MSTPLSLPENLKKIYLMAVCGTGMGSLAGLLKEKGYNVCGSDANVYPPMSTALENQGIPIYSPYDAKNIKNAKPDLVIVGNAISKTNIEAQFLLESDIPYISMPQALKHFFLSDKEVIVVSGTHGKTTTSSIMAHILSELDQDPSFMIGGVTKNFSRNFRIGKGPYFVIEGDEYDTAFFDKGPKFLHYNPKHVIMTSLEFDHADIYEDLEHIQSSFMKLAQIIPPYGSLHYCADYPAFSKVIPQADCSLIRSYSEKSDQWKIKDYQASPDGSQWNIQSADGSLLKIESPLTGIYNAFNVSACLSVLQNLNLDMEKAIESLSRFKGIKRRQDILFENKTHVVIDDFAHHPTAVKETILAIKDKYPKHQLVAIFEPRSNTSRRNIFQNEYVQAFKDAHQVVLAPVNQPEKVKNGAILDIPQIVSELQNLDVLAHNPKNTDSILKLLLSLQSDSPLVFLVMSNGGFDGLHDKLVTALSS